MDCERMPWVVVRRTVHEEAPQCGPGQSGTAKRAEDVLPARVLGDDPAQHQRQRAASRHPWKREIGRFIRMNYRVTILDGYNLLFT